MSAERMCHRCGRKGHMVKNCPTPSSDPLWNKTCVRCGRSGHFVKDCPKPPSYSMPCNVCGQMGHWANECPTKKAEKTTHPCFNCGKSGHWAKECPEVGNGKGGNRGGLDKTTQQCYACGQFGHLSKECADVRRFGGDKSVQVIRVADVIRGNSILRTTPSERQAKLDNLQTQLADLLSQQHAAASKDNARRASAAQLAQLSTLQEQMNELHEQITGKPLLLAPTTAAMPRAGAGGAGATHALPHFLDRTAHARRPAVGVVQVVPKRKQAPGGDKVETKKAKVESLACLVDYGDEEEEEEVDENSTKSSYNTTSISSNTTNNTSSNAACQTDNNNNNNNNDISNNNNDNLPNNNTINITDNTSSYITNT